MDTHFMGTWVGPAEGSRKVVLRVGRLLGRSTTRLKRGRRRDDAEVVAAVKQRQERLICPEVDRDLVKELLREMRGSEDIR
jgi:hypothetical protein